MKGFMKKCKRMLVVALTIALVGNSLDYSMLNVRAEEQTGVEAGSGNVTGGDAYVGENGIVVLPERMRTVPEQV